MRDSFNRSALRGLWGAIGGTLFISGVLATGVLVACGTLGSGGTEGSGSNDASISATDDAAMGDPGTSGDGGNGGDGGGSNRDGMIADSGTPDLAPLPPDLTCVPAATPDVPDPMFLDTNCDGMDGDASNAIFVSPTGDDTNAGTAQNPVKTVGKAIALAAANSKTNVYLSKGTYAESVNLVSGISLYGGFDQAMGWQRAAANVSRIQATGTAISAMGIAAETHVEFLTVDATTGSAGQSSYGVFVSNSVGPVFVRHDQISAGDGAAGAAGTAGTAGASGGNGGNGTGGIMGAAGPTLGGNGGSSVCSRTGGTGGAGSSVAGGAGGAMGSLLVRINASAVPLSAMVAGRFGAARGGSRRARCTAASSVAAAGARLGRLLRRGAAGSGARYRVVMLRLEAGKDRGRNLALQQALDVAQLDAFVAADQRQRFAAGTGTAGTADAVDVVFRHVGQLEVHHARQRIDVQPACRDVGGDQRGELARLEIGQGASSGVL